MKKKLLSVFTLLFLAGFFDLSATGNGYELAASTGMDRLTNGYSDWQNIYVKASKKFHHNQVIYGDISYARRYDLPDGSLLMGFFWPFSEHVGFSAEASAGLGHKFLPFSNFYAEASLEPVHGLIFHLGARRQQYTDSAPLIFTPSVEAYYNHFRFFATLYASNLAAAGWSFSGRFGTNFYYRNESNLGLSLSTGQEIMFPLPYQAVVAHVYSAMLSWRHWWSESWAVDAEFGFLHQGSYYDRYWLNLGARVRF